MTDRPATRKTAAPKTPADEAGKITTTQMRHLHALLREHGITGDRAVHDYLASAGYPVESRSDLDTVDAARLIAELEAAPIATTADAGRLAALREPFPEEAIGKLPRSTCSACSSKEGPRGACQNHPSRGTCGVCGNYHNTQATMHIDFVGHADVTARLLAVDPEWTWEPFTAEQLNGIPPTFRNGLWINLTVLGVTRPGYGDAEGGKGPKEAIGDALRNGAMRFGVALDLWAKGDRDWAHTEKEGTDQHPDSAPPRQSQQDSTPAWTGPSTSQLLARIDALATEAGMTYADFTAKYRERAGGLSVDDLDRLPAPQVSAWVDQIMAWNAQQAQAAPPADDETTPGPGASGEQPPA